MAFSIKRSTKNSWREPPLTAGHKELEKIELEHAKLHDYKGRFLYYPSSNVNIVVQPKSTEEYLQSYHPGPMMQKPFYEKEDLVFDDVTQKWKLIKEEELYKYMNS